MLLGAQIILFTVTIYNSLDFHKNARIIRLYQYEEGPERLLCLRGLFLFRSPLALGT